MPKTKQCESCLMPLDEKHGQADREDERYCSYCYSAGKFTYEGEAAGFRQACYEGMRKHGINPLLAHFYAWMTRFAPRWRSR
jgi:hypothetical protein